MSSALIAPGTKLTYQFSCDDDGNATFHSDSQSPTVEGSMNIGMRVVVSSGNTETTTYDLKTTSSNSDGSLVSEASQEVGITVPVTLTVNTFDLSTNLSFSLTAPANCTGAVEVTY